MYRRFFFAIIVGAATVAMAAEQETVDQLKQRAAAATPDHQARLFITVAERQFSTADNAFNRGNVDEGKAAVGDVAEYCEKAAGAATSSRKHLKNTEIKIRDLVRKLDAMRRTLNFEDREPVQAAIDRMEKARNDLLTAMFGPKS